MAKDASKIDAPVTIKKYANRRLYNTAKSSYVTLDHLAQMVRDGQDFVVFDAKSGDDITRSVLTQIIFEEEAKGQNMLPVNFLRQLIRLYGDAVQGAVPSYLEASMEAFARNQETIREQMRAAMGTNPALANMEAMARGNMDLFQNALRMFAPFAAPKPAAGGAAASGAPEPPAEPAPRAAGAGDLDSLKDQLADMQARLDALAGPKS
ncbi:MAG: polyhydroxyalkanoate synthesis repressor PhaR [Pseudomonadota bacterium]